jgi:hypothetical protein
MKKTNNTSRINVTKTMLEKSICDCNAATREMLKHCGIVDYDKIKAGDKVVILASFKPDAGKKQEVKVSCYRANKRGDKRIWVNGIKSMAKAGQALEFTVRAGKLSIKVEAQQ